MSAILRSIAIIKADLAAGKWPHGERLPPLTELAKQCDVSRTTMWKALAQLQAEFHVHTKRGGHIIAGPSQAAKPTGPHGAYAWKQVKSRIGHDVISGEFGHEIFPPANKMALKYGVAANTLKKSLGDLVADGLIIKEGCRYRAVGTNRQKCPPSVVLISEGTADRGLFINHIRMQQIVESFNRECPHFQYDARTEGFNYRKATGLLEISAALKKDPETAGIIVNIWNPPAGEFLNRWIDLLRYLVGRNVPVIVIDQWGDLSLPDALLRNKNLRVIRLAGIRAGEHVGDFLLRRNHSRVAFVSAFMHTDWARRRYEGLCSCYRRFGGPQANVALYSHDKIADLQDLTPILFGLDMAGIRTLFRRRYSEEELQSILKKLDRIDAQRAVEKIRDKRLVGTIHDIAHTLVSLAKKDPDPAAFDRMLQELWDLASTTALEAHVYPLVLRVVDDFRGGTLVCSDDGTALSALSAMHARGISVPAKMSILGFDNAEKAHERGLSSYDFNMHGIVKQALLMIRDDKLLKSQPAISEIDGYVVERRTTMRKIRES